MKPTPELGMNICIGPHNPFMNGSLKIVAKLSGEIVKSVEPIIGYSHRGIEKLVETMTYVKYLHLVDKIDYLSGFMYQEAYCSAVEKLSGTEIPERAKYIRVLLMELNRISSHLFHLGTYLSGLGAEAQLFSVLKEREILLGIFESICGQRIMCDYFTFGGVKHDLNKDILKKIADFTSEFPKSVREYQDNVINNPIFLDRTQGLGIITKNKALSYGLTGANLRSSGINFDIRKSKPYLVYDRLEFEIPVSSCGDCYSRCLTRIREMIEALKIIQQCTEYLINSSGEYLNNSFNPLQFTPEPDIVISHVESSRGMVSCTIISDGTDKPSRIKWRTPSCYSIQILSELLKNKYYPDIISILGSLDIVVSEADR